MSTLLPPERPRAVTNPTPSTRPPLAERIAFVPDGLQLERLRGLEEGEAQARLRRDGPNELPMRRTRSLPAALLEVVREPMFLMLAAAGAVYLLLGESTDALMLLGFVLVVMSITAIQTRRTERALEALRDLSSPRALAIRGGERRRIAGREVVPGDLLVLSEGDRVPADALLRQALHLSVDESLLTGESLPTRKLPSPDASRLDRPGGDDLPSVFSGTLVTSGHGIVEVVATGPRTQLGKIGQALSQTETELTTLQTETRRIVQILALAGLCACCAVVIGFALTRGGSLTAWKQGLLAGIAMAMAILPEEFPVILTIFLALGAWRLSRDRVLTRRMPAVEMLGAATVLCVDKTGTLTHNQMTLRYLFRDANATDLSGLESDLPEALHSLLEYAILASKRDPFDPMELALHAAGERFIQGTEHLHPTWSLQREYPLAPDLLAVTHAWQTGDDQIVLASKGAPEAIADLCRLSSAQRDALARDVSALASDGLRVLAVARGTAHADRLPTAHHELSLELLGLLGFEDPLRSSVPGAVEECHSAGVRVVMITGDYPATAQSIAKRAGLADWQFVITGSELDRMSDAELAAQVRRVPVFARVVPEQKLRIVTALKANQEVVAMTGDGVNDAPALKAAHIGIAMGGRGTDVAREAASLVLLDDDFSSIVGAVRLGRRIFDNLQRAVVFIVAAHIPIAGLSMLPVFVPSVPLLLLPVHIAFLQLIIDPACTLVFEAERAEPDVMHRPPRPRNVGLFCRETLTIAVLQGVSILAVCIGVFFLSRKDHSIDAARALTFATLVVAFSVVIVVNRSWVRSAAAMARVPNPAAGWMLIGSLAFLAVSVLSPIARDIFHFAPLHAPDLLSSLVAGLTCVLWFELVKAARRLRGGAVTSAERDPPKPLK